MGGGKIGATVTLLNLLGGVALLLWGMRMVEVGINQAFGADLRRLVGHATRNPLLALGVGMGVTGLLQSSTATALITVSFVRHGLLETAPAVAVMLGADVGTALVAQVFAFDLAWLAPLLVLLGVVGFKTSRVAPRQHVSRAILGLGLILFGLRQIVGVSAPLRASAAMQDVLGALSGETVVVVLLAALLTWLAHSSLAMVLLVVSLVGNGAVTLPMGLAMVLGANLGGGMPQLVATFGGAPEVKRIAVGNLLFKAVGVAVALALLDWAPDWLATLPGAEGRQVAHFHLAFNAVVAVAFLPFTRPIARWLTWMLPDEPRVDDPVEPRYLDPGAIGNPAVALAHAERETLRMGDVVERMLSATLDILRHDDERQLAQVERQEETVDALHRAIKFYLTELGREPMSPRDTQRAQAIISFTINLEQIGDIVEKKLMELAAKKIQHRLHFSEEGFLEIASLHKRVMDNLKLAFAVFMAGDVEMARQLLAEKTRFREMERTAAENHLARLRGARVESIDTSSIHLDILNELRRINSHLCTVAYPILESAGELFTSRLKPSA